MDNTMNRDEGQLFGLLRKMLHRDLIALGWPSSVSGAALNWFDPRTDDYLQHVDAWQKSLCAGEFLPGALPDAVRLYMRDSTCVERCYVDQVEQLHFIAKLFYKFRGRVRQPEGTCLEAAKIRLARPGRPKLSQSEKTRLGNVLNTLRAPAHWEQLVGAFGPGVTADRLDEFGKWCRDGEFPRRVPITLFVSSIFDYADMGQIRYRLYGVTKVAEVPKSIKTNRVVSSEPANWMFAQKAVAAFLVRELHHRFRGNVSLTDQDKHNELLWQHGFRSIDLSDASDHISRSLVKQIFPPKWCEYLFAVRSSFARFPDGTIVPLRTMAPMGSGICFPVLTAVCLAICEVSCQHHYHVYGDDVIVHTDDYDRVVELMDHCGLVVNDAKCAQTTSYRESCGLELFYDEEITPVYIHEDWVRTPASKLELISKRFEELGFFATREAILQECKPFRRFRWKSDLQLLEVETLQERPPKDTRLPANHGLNRWYCIAAEHHRVAVKGDRGYSWRFEPAHNYPTLLSLIPRE